MFYSLQGNAQKAAVISYAEVVKADSASKEMLYIRARDWFISKFKDNKEVLRIQDKEAGQNKKIVYKNLYYYFVPKTRTFFQSS